MAQKKKPCGTLARYTGGCRCEPCKDAGRKYRKERNSDPDRKARHDANNQRYQERNKDKIKERRLEFQRTRRQEVRKELQRIKETSPCSDCGNNYPYYVMDFDHMPGEDKVDTVSYLASRLPLDKVLEEVTKCEIVCSNCHRIRTYVRSQ
jgi:hypothetical protein